jgi:hypothetical protein
MIFGSIRPPYPPPLAGEGREGGDESLASLPERVLMKMSRMEDPHRNVFERLG